MLSTSENVAVPPPPPEVASSSVPPPPPPPPAEDPSSSSGKVAEFTPSASFDGARPGFCFKLDSEGLGYYKDTPVLERARSRPTMLKSNRSIIKGLAGRSMPPAKKLKADKPGESDKAQPAYLREMAVYNAMSCSADTKHDRPLVK